MVLIMKKIATQIILSAVLVFGSVGITEAQKNKIRYADQQMELMNYKTSSALYQQAYAKKPTMDAAVKVAKSYEALRDYDNAYTWWKTAAGYDEFTVEDAAYFLSNAEMSGNLEEAVAMLSAKEFASSDSTAVKTLMMSRPKMQAVQAPAGRGKVKLEPMAELNSAGSDFTYAKDAKGNVYFTSDQAESL
jgi:tetratricopeptide (TPR) repeat protein